jgi:hypothetical protein
MRAEPVTSDWSVAKSMLQEESGLCWTSAEIAENLSITVFQITARLKGMQGRELVERVEEFWRLTMLGEQLATSPEPPKKEKLPIGERIYRTPTGGYYSPGAIGAALPDDSSVPRRSAEDAHGWRLRYEWGIRTGQFHLSDSYTTIFTDPDGIEWVKCAPTEIAELIVPEGRLTLGLPDVRLRRRNGATVAEKKIQRGRKAKRELEEHMEAQRSK